MQQSPPDTPRKQTLLNQYLKGHFKKQRIEAIQYFNKLDPALEESITGHMTISEELHLNGSRRFANGKPEAIFEKIQGDNDLPLYEIIPPNVPIRYFLDIEAHIETNDAIIKQTVEAVLIVLNKICEDNEWLKVSYNDIVIMSASTASKLSIHIIFKTMVLPNIAHAGALTRTMQQSIVEDEMQYFIGQLPEENLSRAHLIYENPTKREPQLMIDVSVYSRNQNFRMIHCSKLNQKRPLKFVPEAQLTFENFLGSLVGFYSAADQPTITYNLKELDGSSPILTASKFVSPQRHLPKKFQSKYGNDIVNCLEEHFITVLGVNVRKGQSTYKETDDDSALGSYNFNNGQKLFGKRIRSFVKQGVLHS